MALLQCEIDSESLRMDTQLIVFLPHDKSKAAVPRAILYLLHGRGSSGLSWIRNTNIELFAIKHGLALIMPSAGRSFYTDMAFGGAYFSYITQELPELCKKMFHLDYGPENTYIAGISMGGYGTLKCVLNYPERYAAAAAIGSVTDIAWRINDTPAGSGPYRDLQGVFGADPAIEQTDDLFALAPIAAQSPHKPGLFMACGNQDDKQEQNQRLSDILKKNGFDNTYLNWDGGHNWDFFLPAMDKALAFVFEGAKF